MRFSIPIVLASAIATFAQDTPGLIAARAVDNVSAWGEESKLDTRQISQTFEIPATSQVGEGPEHPVKLTLSTRCAAEARGGVSKRSVDAEQHHMEKCSVPGYLTHPGTRINIRDITYDQCANDCVCQESYNGCLAFAWRENKLMEGKGHCLMFDKTLHDMGFMPGTDPEGKGHRNHLFYSRSCYRKTLPKPSHIHTKKPTATPTKLQVRTAMPEVDIDADLILAMERI